MTMTAATNPALLPTLRRGDRVFDRYRATTCHGMGEIFAINADFSYPPFDVLGQAACPAARTARWDGRVRRSGRPHHPFPNLFSTWCPINANDQGDGVAR